MPPTCTGARSLLRASLAGVVMSLLALSVLPVAQAAVAAVPTSVSPPTIAGGTVEGQTLTANPGTWTGTTPITFTYHWQRCNSTGGSCTGPIATGPTHVIGTDAVGDTLRVRVTATNAAGSDSATSTATAVITASATTTTATTTATTPPPASNGCGTSGSTIPVADVSLPAQLSIDESQILPSTVTYGTRSLTIRIHVSACGGSVEGALVYATAVPYGQFSVPNEEPTGSDGWATLQFTALPGFPVSTKQELLVVFVRASAPGASVIGGISARLLISFRVAK